MNQVVPFQGLRVEWTPKRFRGDTAFLPCVTLIHETRTTQVRLEMFHFPELGWRVAKITVGKALPVEEDSLAQDAFEQLFGKIVPNANPHASTLSTIRTALLESGRVGATREWKNHFVTLTVSPRKRKE